MDNIKITTPENIELEYELAGLGSRYVGAVVDHTIQFFVIGILALVLVISQPDFDINHPLEIFHSVLAAFIVVLISIVTLGYFIFFETIWAGQTPGKKVAQIQVVKDNGEPAGFMEAVLRNVFRLIDSAPFMLYYLGIAFIWFRKDRKRVGDIVARTIVVKQKPNLQPVALPPLNIRSDILINVAPMKEKEYALIRDFLIVRYHLKHDIRQRIALKLGTLMQKKLDMLEPIQGDVEEFLEVAALEYRSYKKML